MPSDAREIAKKIVDDVVSRAVGIKPLYDSVDLGERWITSPLAARDAEIARLKAERDEAAAVTKAAAMLISEIAALVPIPEILTATYSTGDLIAWVRTQKGDLTAAREALRLAAKALVEAVESDTYTSGFEDEDEAREFALRGASAKALRTIVAILPDALDGAPDWVRDAVGGRDGD